MSVGDPYRKVTKGEAFSVGLNAWNKLLDLARPTDLGRTGGEAGELAPGVGAFARIPTFVKVRNDTGDDMDRFAVLGLDTVLIAPDDNLPEFHRVMTFSGVVPVDPDHKGRFCVLQEPLADGQIGDAVVSGITPVLLSSDGNFADVTDGDPTQLTAADGGNAKVLWSDSGTSTRWAIVRLGDGISDPVAGNSVTVLTSVTCTSGSIVGTTLVLSGYVEINGAQYPVHFDLSGGAASPLPVSAGGTGQTTLTAGSILVGNGTGPIAQVGPGTNYQGLYGVTGGNPVFRQQTVPDLAPPAKALVARAFL